MINRILCAVDLTHSDDSRKLLAEADRLADVYDASLSVVTVLPDYNSSWVGTFFKDGTLKEAASAANDALHALVKEALPRRAKVQHIVEIGVVYEQVLKAISQSKADLVIIGAHKPAMADKLLGPNSARIARLSPVSTLIFRG